MEVAVTRVPIDMYTSWSCWTLCYDRTVRIL